MKVTLEREALSRRLRVCDRIVPSKGNVPFFYAIQFETDGDGVVTIWAGNGREAYGTQLMSGQDSRAGSAAIPALELVKAVAAAPGETVVIDVGPSGKATVTSGGAEWHIEALAEVEPTAWAGDFTRDDFGEVASEELVRVLEGARYAASKTDTHPAFRQVHVGEGRVIAADGRRVHQEVLEQRSMPAFDLPETAVDTLLEALAGEGTSNELSEWLGVAVDEEGEMTFGLGTMQYAIGKLAYPFPEIDALVLDRAREQKAAVTVNLEDLVTALKVASVVIEPGQAVELEFKTGTVGVSGVTQRSDGRMDVSADVNVRAGQTVNVVADDLLEMLGKVGVADDKMITFTVGSDADPGWVYVSADGTEAAVRPVVV